MNLIVCKKDNKYYVLAESYSDELSDMLDIFKECIEDKDEVKLLNIEDDLYAEIEGNINMKNDTIKEYFESQKD